MFTAENICLNYSYKKVLTGVNASFEKGKIYSILGENGAGKSTFAHILCGDLQPTGGKLVLNGKKVSFANPHQALQVGIACLHQRPLLAESISVKENILLGAGKITAQQIDELLKIWLPEISKKTLVKKLDPAQKFFTALCGLLLKNPEILILDEPSALLNEAQNQLLYSKLRDFASLGMTVIIITHYLKEALTESDEILILKKGIVEASGQSCSFSESKIKYMLYGDSENSITENLKPRNESCNINSSCEQSELSEDKLTGMADNSIRKLRKAGTAIIPSDRTFRASNPRLTILQLVTTYKTNLKKKELINYALAITKRAQVNIKLNEKASNLSGGMLQRLILERELDTNPSTVIFCSPYQGLDVAASQKLSDLIEKLKQSGKKIIIIGEKE